MPVLLGPSFLASASYAVFVHSFILADCHAPKNSMLKKCLRRDCNANINSSRISVSFLSTRYQSRGLDGGLHRRPSWDAVCPFCMLRTPVSLFDYLQAEISPPLGATHTPSFPLLIAPQFSSVAIAAPPSSVTRIRGLAHFCSILGVLFFCQPCSFLRVRCIFDGLQRANTRTPRSKRGWRTRHTAGRTKRERVGIRFVGIISWLRRMRACSRQVRADGSQL